MLFARHSCYSDLRDGLSGIATNLLADRRRQLQADGLIEAYEAPPAVRATVYRLTRRGRELGPVLRSLVQSGMPLLAAEQADDTFRPQWLMLELRILFDEVDATGIGPLTIAIINEYEPITIEVGAGRSKARSAARRHRRISDCTVSPRHLQPPGRGGDQPIGGWEMAPGQQSTASMP